MGKNERMDSEEIKFICELILKGKNDTQIKDALLDDWGNRDRRTIYYVRMVFEAAQEVLTDRLAKIRDILDGPSKEYIERTIEIVEKMSQGLRPVYNEKTGEITYEGWLEI